MKILAIIPARGGSKGISRKNIKLLCGKPLIAYTIEQVIASNSIDEHCISTDDQEIAEVAVACGGNVEFIRPKELATDSSASIEFVKHAIHFYESKGKKFDAVLLLQPTSFLRPAGSIDEAIKLFKEKQPDSLVSVRKVPDHYNPHWVFEINEEGSLSISTKEEQIITRRQDLPPAYHRDGAIYLSKVSSLLKYNSFLGLNNYPYIVESDTLINIDTPDDWINAERYVKKFGI